ncbi:hypothetical protein L7F22_050225 [Adiantum nelumboides]|nr:hypothetical protein [Adiantum nelumboides]
MVHPLNSAQLDLNVQHDQPSGSHDHIVAETRSRSGSVQSDEQHRPGVSPPLSLTEENQVDIEHVASNFSPQRSASIWPTSPHSREKQKQKMEDVRLPEAALSAAAASLTNAATRPGAEGKSHGEKQSAWLDSATSPLHLDTTKVPPVNIIPHLSPEGTFSINDAYAMGYITPASEESDPLLLRSKVVNADQELRRRPSKGRRTERKIRNYYEKQNTLIENLLKPIAKHAKDDEDEAEAANGMVKFLIYLNIVANFVLAGLQLYAAISSLSLSLFATAADSVFDPFANIVLNLLHRKSHKLDERKWPIGGSRLENAGNIVYAAIMGCVSVVLIVESARDIGSHKPGEINTLYYPSLIAVGVAFLTKAVLGVFNYMYRKHSSQLDMLWVDCRNDLFINGFGIFTSAAGAKIAWWLDPSGAILISFGIIFSWSRAAYEQFRELCGVAAPVEFLQLCTYNALHIHYPHIDMIDSVKAYHSGPKYIVEVDIVMKPETPLWLSHNVSQDLQDKIEQLPMCERAFVHVDFEVDHRPEHQAAKKVK